MAKIVFLLCLLVLNLSAGGQCTSNGAEFRAFYFVQHWLGSYCNQKGTTCCNPPGGKPAANFTIRGMWPYFSDGTFPYNCPGPTSDVTPLKPLEERLQKVWPSMTCPQIGRKFWLHQWNKHGTCTKSILDMKSYLEAAINLKNKMDFLKSLINVGIKPNNNNNQLYALDKIKEAITKDFGFQPWINCNTNSQGKKQIWQIILCVDTSGSNLIDCPFIPKGSQNCDPMIMFPSF